MHLVGHTIAASGWLVCLTSDALLGPSEGWHIRGILIDYITHIYITDAFVVAELSM
jgi:hypothetical protein